MSDQNMGNDRWLDLWKNDHLPFHLDHVHPFIKNFIDHLVAEQPPLQPRRILVPLCGKTVDMMFLYNIGLSVVGIELSPIACESYFTEHNLSFSKENKGAITVWKHDERLVLYEGDLFNTSADIIGGVCDLHWDRGSFVALPVSMHNKYAEHVKTLLSSKSMSLIECFEYDTTERQPPPNCIPFESLKAAFGESFVYKELCREEDEKMEPSQGLAGVTHVLYFLERE